MSAIPKPDWEGLMCFRCDEIFTREDWMGVDTLHWEQDDDSIIGESPVHSRCCQDPECIENELHDRQIQGVD